jgi:outer membrane biogenesis lipoprotein LolB
MQFKSASVIYILLFAIVLFSCKSSKTLNTGIGNLNLNTKQLIKENTLKAATFKTLTARVKIDITQGAKENSYTVNMRMEKDKQILLMSSPITVVKALITPEKVSFYNKLDNTYFEGDFKYLSDLLGTELDFKKVQNLLLGEALYGLKDSTYDVSVNEKEYILQPKKQNGLFELFYFINPSHFKISSQQITQPQQQRQLQIDYKSYQEVDKQVLPEHIKVIAVEATEEMILEMEFKAVSLNEDLRFPFKIPAGLKEIKL